MDLKTHQRAIVWVDGRLEVVLKPGVYALWTVFRDVRVEVVDARVVLFEHEQLAAILALPGTAALLEAVTVEAGHAGLLFRDGRHEATLAPGAYAFWKGVARAMVVPVDLREQVVDVAGQEIMTADKVTLRLNAVVTFKVADAAAGRDRGRGLPSGPLPGGAAGAARHRRRADAGGAARREGGGGPRARRRAARSASPRSVSRSSRSASGT